jgi:hypothetical protein
VYVAVTRVAAAVGFAHGKGEENRCPADLAQGPIRSRYCMH